MSDDITMRVLRVGKQVKHAIDQRLRLKFIYNSKDRIVDPYIFGVSQKNHLILSAYQIALGWRTFDMTEVDKVEVLGENYSLIDSYNPEDPNFKEVLCQV